MRTRNKLGAHAIEIFMLKCHEQDDLEIGVIAPARAVLNQIEAVN